MVRNKWIYEGKRSIIESVRKIENQVDEVEGLRSRESNREHGNLSLIPLEKHRWIALDREWIAVNIDAATKNGKNALTWVARDDQGCIVYMAIKYCGGLAADMAELSALEWVAEMVASLRWPKVLWWSDAKVIVDQFLAKKKTTLWQYRH